MHHRISALLAFSCLVVLWFLPLSIQAQKIVADITVVLEKLPMEKRDKLVDFQQNLIDYINQYDWCESRYQMELPVQIQIYLQDASVSYEERYKGNLLISNKSDMQFYDKRWRFDYDPMEPLQHNEAQFDALTSVLDFYIYIILGGEYDKFGKFEGSPFYERAQKIDQQARFSRFIEGWDERKLLINSILAKENQSYREAVDAFYLGLSYANEDSSVTRKYCKKAVDLLAQLINTNHDYPLPHQFVDGHRIELINIFKDATDYHEVFQTLIIIDPDHKQDYAKYL